LLAPADLQQPVAQLHQRVKALLSKNHEPEHGTVTFPVSRDREPWCGR
jgi:hypothetical protein